MLIRLQSFSRSLVRHRGMLVDLLRRPRRRQTEDSNARTLVQVGITSVQMLSENSLLMNTYCWLSSLSLRSALLHDWNRANMLFSAALTDDVQMQLNLLGWHPHRTSIPYAMKGQVPTTPGRTMIHEHTAQSCLPDDRSTSDKGYWAQLDQQLRSESEQNAPFKQRRLCRQCLRRRSR